MSNNSDIKVVIGIYHHRLREIIHEREILIDLKEDEITINHVLKKLGEKFGDHVLHILRNDPETSILVNGRDIEYLEGFDTKLSHGDKIVIISLIAGGSN